jgi:hypothetical protein
MMNPKANAVLAMLLTSTSNSKANTTRYKREKDLGDGNPNEVERVRVALVDADRGWDAVKRECVLLKRK